MNQFDQTVDNLRKQLKNIPSDERHEWLRTLHSNYTQRFTKDNERIWTTGAIIIPLSLGGFVAFISIKDPTRPHAYVIGIASILLMLSWVFVAENFRAFQDKSLAWIRAVEKEAGIENSYGHKISGNIINRIFTFVGRIQVIRITLLILVIVGWIVIWMGWPY